MTIFKANFNTRYSVSLSGSRASHNIYKWVATQRSLGTPGLWSRAYMILIRHYCRKQMFVSWGLWRLQVSALHPGQKGPDPLPVFCTGEAPPGPREAYIRDETVFIFATSWSDCGGRPWEQRTFSAYIYRKGLPSLIGKTVISYCSSNKEYSIILKTLLDDYLYMTL